MSSSKGYGSQVFGRRPKEIAFTLAFFWMGATFAFSPTKMTPSLYFKTPPRVHGTASWYSKSDPHINELTASGEVFDDKKTTCASWDFPFGTYIKVTNVQNGEYVICRVNDRGPNESLNRVIDLTKSSFQKIADPDLGLIEITATPLPRLDALRM